MALGINLFRILKLLVLVFDGVLSLVSIDQNLLESHELTGLPLV